MPCKARVAQLDRCSSTVSLHQNNVQTMRMLELLALSPWCYGAQICWRHMASWWACTPFQPQHSEHFAALLPEWSAFTAVISETNSINSGCKYTEAANVALIVWSLEAGKFYFYFNLKFKMEKSNYFYFFAILHFARSWRCSIDQAPCKVCHLLSWLM